MKSSAELYKVVPLCRGEERGSVVSEVSQHVPNRTVYSVHIQT